MYQALNPMFEAGGGGAPSLSAAQPSISIFQGPRVEETEPLVFWCFYFRTSKDSPAALCTLADCGWVCSEPPGHLLLSIGVCPGGTSTFLCLHIALEKLRSESSETFGLRTGVHKPRKRLAVPLRRLGEVVAECLGIHSEEELAAAMERSQLSGAPAPLPGALEQNPGCSAVSDAQPDLSTISRCVPHRAQPSVFPFLCLETFKARFNSFPPLPGVAGYKTQ